jgi:atypical dual specificity phosphatase
VTDSPPYPRIAHLVAGRGTGDDRVLETGQLRELLAKRVVVEEKLDGANMVLWSAHHRVECSLRSGPGAMDRAGQLGRLRAWIAERTDALRGLLADGSVLYVEWLYLTHAVRYTSLPDSFVALDLRRANGSFLTPDERTQECGAVGLQVPPEIWRGVAGGMAAIEVLLGQSRWAAEPAEGLIIRTIDGSEPRIAKLVRRGFHPLKDREWKKTRPRNVLAGREASWH